MKFELPKLTYRYDALEPYIDAKTMELHYTKHHQAYVNNLNTAMEKHPELSGKSVEELIKNLETIPADIRTAVRNHGGGHLNHTFFWKIMAPLQAGGGGEPKMILRRAIDSSFGGFPKFKEEFAKMVGTVFGSGWVWLGIDKDKKLKLVTTPNQDSPLLSGVEPLLGLDVWEHAYYLLYQNRRPDYVTAWWSVVNWEQVENNFEAVTE